MSCFPFWSRPDNEVFVVRWKDQEQHFDKNVASLLNGEKLLTAESQTPTPHVIELIVEEAAPVSALPITQPQPLPITPPEQHSQIHLTVPMPSTTEPKKSPIFTLLRSIFGPKHTTTLSPATKPEEQEEEEYESLGPLCSVCFVELDEPSTYTPSCFSQREGHEHLCTGCARKYVNTSAVERRFPMPCTDLKCGGNWTWDDLRHAVGGDTTADWAALRWARIAQLISTAERIVHCPLPNCGCAMQVQPNSKPSSIRCVRCSARLCLRCDETHPGQSCRQYASGKNSFQIVEARNLIRQACKPCPRCRSPIEKNDGCNHMTCRKCTHQFCWVCLKPHVGHSSSSCVAPKDPWGTLTKYKLYAHLFARPAKVLLKVVGFVVAAPVVIGVAAVVGPIYILCKLLRFLTRGLIKRYRVWRWRHAPPVIMPCTCAGEARCYMCATEPVPQA